MLWPLYGQVTEQAVENARRFQPACKLEDLEVRIRYGKQMVGAMPEDQAGYLCHLGILIEWRFMWIWRTEDQEEAIHMMRQEVEATPKGHPRLAARLRYLGAMPQSRFERTQEIEDLEKAYANPYRQWLPLLK